MWSDINNPEDFEVTRSKEADIFNLGANANEVTGLAWTEGVVVTFTKILFGGLTTKGTTRDLEQEFLPLIQVVFIITV